MLASSSPQLHGHHLPKQPSRVPILFSVAVKSRFFVPKDACLTISIYPKPFILPLLHLASFVFIRAALLMLLSDAVLLKRGPE
jgi:hypothetical protein